GLEGLLESSPALFAAVVQYFSTGIIGEKHLPELRNKLRVRQRDLLRWLGLGCTEAHCKILRKFSRYDLSYSQWRTVGRNIASVETSKVLQQSPIVSDEVMRFLADDRLRYVLAPSAQAECIKHLLNKGDYFQDIQEDINGLLSL